MMTTQSWSRTESGDDFQESLSAFQESLPVRLIATSRSDFKTCRSDESLSEAVERNRHDKFDFLPVMRSKPGGGETVAGVLHVATLMSGVSPEQTVRDHMQPLGEEHLIGADASLLTFIRDADRHPFRLVVSDREISGLVSISDLQRLPVRAALFAIVTQLEMTMAGRIRSRFAQPDAWMVLLSEQRARNVRDTVAKAKTADTLVDLLLYTQFCDKVTIIHKASQLGNGWPEMGSFRKDMKDIQTLRDNLAHANDFADTRDRAKSVCECVRRMDGWIKSLTVCASEPIHKLPQIPSEGV